MAPIPGPAMVPEMLRVIKFATSRAKVLIRSTALNAVRTYTQKPIAIHPTALLKQSKQPHPHRSGARSYSSPSNLPTKSFSGPKYDRSSFPSSRTSRAITQKGAAPFASTLRPNLTGGTLSRSAGGYSLGGAGKARQFSHTTGCQAQVVQNVSAGIRALLVNGSKARFDGVDSSNGEKRWKAVTKAQDTVHQKWETANAQYTSSPKGTSLEFRLSPTITALLPAKLAESSSPAAAASTVADQATTTLNTPDMLQTLSSDFARAFRDLALITHDLSALSTFGDLPVSLSNNAHGPLLRVRFPGCDADAVSALCDEAGIRRGVIVEDPAWVASCDVEMALLFPFAPADGSEGEQEDEDVQDYFRTRLPIYQRQRETMRQSVERDRTHSFSTTSLYDLPSPSSALSSDLSTLHFDELPAPSQSRSQSDGFEDQSSELYIEEGEQSLTPPSPHFSPSHLHPHTPAASTTAAREDFEGVEGIYRFLTAIDDARRPRPVR